MPHAWPMSRRYVEHRYAGRLHAGRRHARRAAAVLLAWMGTPLTAHALAPLRVVTEELAPYNMTVGGKVTGLSTEVVEAVLKDMDMPSRIQVMPWARAYDLALHADNVLIYSIVRTPEREALFQWAGPIAAAHWFLFSTQARPVPLNSLQEALDNRYQIATVNQDAGEQYLKGHAFKIGQTLQHSNQYLFNYEKLKQGHVALWISDELSAAYLARAHGKQPQTTLYRSLALPDLGDGAFSVAFSLNTPAHTVQRFRDGLQRLYSDGRYEAISHRWLGR